MPRVIKTDIQLLRLVFCRQTILAEWYSRASNNFFCAATISGFLLAMGLLPYSILLAKVLWIAAVGSQIFFLTCTFCRWLIDQLDTHEISPVWLISMVGNASPAFTGVDLGFPGLSKMLLFSALLCWALKRPAPFAVGGQEEYPWCRASWRWRFVPAMAPRGH